MARPTSSSRLYFINGPVDFLLIGGASILVYLFFRFFHNGQPTDLLSKASWGLLFLANWPHFAATNFRLYHSRENMMQYPLTAFLIPVVMFGAAAASFVSPEGVAPYFVKILLVWSPYHYSAQSVGISLIYARRSGMMVQGLERFFLSSFIFGTFISRDLENETQIGMQEFYGIHYPSLGLPQWAYQLSLVWVTATAIGLGVFFIRRRFFLKEKVPLIFLLPAATQFVWFVVGPAVPVYGLFVPFFHGVQYLLIAWMMQLSEKMQIEKQNPSPQFATGATLRWYAMILLLGVVLFLPTAMEAIGYSALFSIGILSAVVQIHHFFVDGVIWKLRKPSVSSPLLSTLGDLSTPAPARGARR